MSKKTICFAISILIIISAFFPITFGYFSISIEQKPMFPFFSRTLYVGGTGPGNYSKIKDAVNDADNGDTVFVYNGKYFESDIQINRSINIIGEDKYKTIVWGRYFKGNVFQLNSPNIFIKNFTVDESQGFPESFGIRINSKQNIIEDIIIKETMGIYINGGHGVDVDYNLIRNCSVINSSWGLRSYDCGFWTIENSYFSNNMNAFYISEPYNCNIINCTFENDDNILMFRSNNSLIKDCKIFLDGKGDAIDLSHGGNGNSIINCRIGSASNGIIFHGDGKNNAVKDCYITNCRDDGIQATWDQSNFKVENCIIENVRYGIRLGGFSNNCIISRCQFYNCSSAGILFDEGPFWNSEISRCHFQDNKYGIIMRYNNFFNRFYYNNFINKDYNIYCLDLEFMFNFFKGNYWNIWDGTGPYHVWGFLNWDFKPVKEPYDVDNYILKYPIENIESG